MEIEEKEWIKSIEEGKRLLTMVHRIIPNLITLILIVSRQMMGTIALLSNRERERKRNKKPEHQSDKSKSKHIKRDNGKQNGLLTEMLPLSVLKWKPVKWMLYDFRKLIVVWKASVFKSITIYWMTTIFKTLCCSCVFQLISLTEYLEQWQSQVLLIKENPH